MRSIFVILLSISLIEASLYPRENFARENSNAIDENSKKTIFSPRVDPESVETVIDSKQNSTKNDNSTIINDAQSLTDVITDGQGAEETKTGSSSDDSSSWRMIESSDIFLVIVKLVGIALCFVALAIVGDEYFADSLEVISDRLHLSPSVAGATFMAAGSSAPELFTALADAVGTKNDIGPATIAGSAVFNLLVIPGLCAALTGKSLRLDWRPIMRDSAFYALSIVLVGLFIVSSNQVDWWEAMILLLTYALYILWMTRDESLLLRFFGPSSVEDAPDDQDQLLEAGTQMTTISEAQEEPVTETKTEEEEEEEEGKEAETPTCFGRIMGLVSAPFRFIFSWTIPQCKDGRERFFLLSFLASVAWIGLFTWLMVQMANQVGQLLSIHPSVMGLVILAAGTSVPDTMASIFVARRDKADQAISNAIGSNVFDMLLGLGLPWLFSCILFGSSVKTHEEGGSGPVIIALAQLALLLVIFLLLLRYNQWILTPRVGFVFFGLYLAYVVVNVTVEFSRK